MNPIVYKILILLQFFRRLATFLELANSVHDPPCVRTGRMAHATIGWTGAMAPRLARPNDIGGYAQGSDNHVDLIPAKAGLAHLVAAARQVSN
jgi:hypothetical protein